MQDKPHEECGVFGIYDYEGLDVAHTAYTALYALQHRGQESCGIAVNDDGIIRAHKDLGLVPDVFQETELNKLGAGQMAVGHVRYSTTGGNTRENAQPLVMKYAKGTIALAHNGNLVNAFELRKQLEQSGAIFQSTNDTEVMAYIVARNRLHTPSIEQAFLETMKTIRGAYSVVLMSPRKLIAARDPQGYRPLCVGQVGKSVVFASETCALDAIGADYVRDVEPGEIVVAEGGRITSIRELCGQKPSQCIFEFIYFARPDSFIGGASVHLARKEAGRCLAKEYPVEADLVVGVPDSGIDAALGYAEESGIPYGLGFIKNRYVGRTFIQPTQIQRARAVRIKLNALRSAVAGKRVVMVDDSIVRGTTSARIVALLREAGATEVHVRISSPPFTNPCYFGTDIDSRDNLIACRMSIPEIRDTISADSLGYLRVEDLAHIVPGLKDGYCAGCFTGRYAVEVPDDVPKDRFERKLSEKKNAVDFRIIKNENGDSDAWPAAGGA
ncbi:amidophosphoribosyltransferase [Ethanoligenens harbinense]|uniref:Amidophosphoribosyltransferase n=1 Tax=Ethanoligenens harbinense (strain DSM 18485 / JCM 12961 / CGMCC 1.5033 / YUAN-3) TaxID=663278 RepID=E6U6P4_ETHHY|nr:amidophosphoribosyltransferase [Ethanoligenens harbinense]ADU25777.1 amidophosphoribosyltransferase [Ethanoligenens harbinense YUAN-3]AVQ94946.1 amidophosphoribosyltransferase [Ethanoligenens harbinense YUAN-3]AYF37638.1 amidophosphoribosyltransferase [Ethanoligenens harbinense]AYF40358.1 amidophosphoribosyltransferase [Ethanoligenens harbinense]QCN91194.1 amidophosphoribosyltransferase [Ethanoligenens harbinense]